MPTFKLYRSRMAHIIKMIRKYRPGVAPKAMSKRDMMKEVIDWLNQSPHMFEPVFDGNPTTHMHIAFAQCVAEVLNEECGSPVWFVQSPELVTFLDECSFSLDCATCDGLPPSIQLAVPFGSKVMNRSTNCLEELPPGLFTSTTHQKTSDLLSDMTNGARRCLFSGQPSKFSWMFDGRFDDITIDLFMVADFDEERTAVECARNNFEYHGLKTKPQLAFIAKLLTYVRAFPHALRSGIPNNAKTDSTRHVEANSRCFTVEVVKEIRDPGVAHLRRGHFATLRDERYKREPDGSPRVIFRRPCIVNGQELDPYTVNDIHQGASTT